MAKKIFWGIFIVVLATLLSMMAAARADATPPPPPDPPPAVPTFTPTNAGYKGVTVTWVKYETRTNIVLMAKDTFKTEWPMQTCTNLIEGAWTNEPVEILIGIETNVPSKFFKRPAMEV